MDYQNLIDAVILDDLCRVRFLVKMGIDLHANQEQAMMTALIHNSQSVAKFLLEMDANIDVIKQQLASTDTWKCHPDALALIN